MSISLSAEQFTACCNIITWFCDTATPRRTLGGLAGTGKTTLIRHLLDLLQGKDYNVSVAAYTGKAVDVLRSKGIPSQTLHSFLYIAEKDPKTGKFTFHKRPKSELKCDLLIVDEASMVSSELYRDIHDHFGLRTLYVGDHGQLEPIGDNPNLMALPDDKLETIHRQALSSPIIPFAHSLREGKSVTYSTSDPVLRISTLQDSAFDPSFQLICGFNPTRHKLNAAIRGLLKHTDTLVPGERLICLRNSQIWSIFNGQMFTLKSVSFRRDVPMLTLIGDNGDTYGPLPCVPSVFGSPDPLDKQRIPWVEGIKKHEYTYFDYAYCVTGHKSQGSEWPKVAVIEERAPRLWSPSRWAYTCATRARDTLHWLTPFGVRP